MTDIDKRNMAGLFGIFLLVIIGLALTPSIQEQVINVTTTIQSGPGLPNSTLNNLTGASRAVALLVPLFWVILVLAVGAGGIVVWLKTV